MLENAIFGNLDLNTVVSFLLLVTIIIIIIFLKKSLAMEKNEITAAKYK